MGNCFACLKSDSTSGAGGGGAGQTTKNRETVMNNEQGKTLTYQIHFFTNNFFYFCRAVPNIVG